MSHNFFGGHHEPAPSRCPYFARGFVNQVYDVAAQASDPAQLAQLLSPIVDASFALEDTSAAVVQATVAETQSSAEYWYQDNYSAIQDVVEAEHTDLVDGCASGQYEGYSFEVDGTTYACDGGYWVASAMTHARPQMRDRVSFVASSWASRSGHARRRSSSQFKVVSLTHSGDCEVSNGALYAGIIVSDAFGAGLGAWRFWGLGPAGIAAGAAYYGLRSSGSGAVAAAGVRAYCMFAE